VTDEQDPKPSGDTPSETPPVATPPAETPPAEATPPADVVATPTPAAYTTDVVEVGATERKGRKNKDDDEGLDEEPPEASRTSPFSVAAFAVSLLALFQAPQNVFTAQGLQSSQFVRYILPTFIVPVGAAVAALYLAYRASEEVFVGRLGGVGFIHAARVIATFVLIVVIAASVLVLFFSEAPQAATPFG
jgi:hypothetical protein